MSVIKLNKENFDEIIGGEKKVLIDFYADWCGPCRMVSPIIDEIAEENSEIAVCKVNVDENPDLAGKFGIMSIPTIVVMEKGEIINKSMGAKPKAQILAMLG
ncbi:MAG: thioredoxin [Clostridia bacterium]|nr:thioredoxin [Clostridia bacterium]